MQNLQTHRPIRSFILRQGRITPAQQQAMDRLWPIYGIAPPSAPLELAKVFGRTAPTVLEIGFGNGQSLAEMADNQRDSNFLGIEVHKPGVGHLMLELERRQLEHVRVLSSDAMEVLRQGVADQSLSRVNLYFPDPWHKKRHHKRRIVNQEFLELVSSRLQPGGILHCATDWENYAEHMMQELESCPSLTNMAGSNQYIARPADRPVTKFEKRGLRLGHKIHDLMFKKV